MGPRWLIVVACVVAALGVSGAHKSSCEPRPEGCVEGTACDDGDPCTENDECGACGQCAGAPLSCDDGLSCTEDACVEGVCSHAALPGWQVVGGACYEAGTAPVQLGPHPRPSSFAGSSRGGGMLLRTRATPPATGTAAGGDRLVRTAP